MKPLYIYDPTVSQVLDVEIRELLCQCFKDARFRYQRFNYELPVHRWILRNGEGKLLAHVGVHDKRLGSEKGELRVAGLAEVCVHPEARGNGYMRRLVGEAHRWCRAQGIDFATLFGKSEIYGRFGYVPQNNQLELFDVEAGVWKQKSFPHFQVLPFSAQSWPRGLIQLFGPEY
ncbi:GNAT family N-acetyltransferase [Kiritimatiellaeota bacterium B1221]|nr:GNAT family N-acetyltransferase [Kiritimatiellaeota bacterium B1221]